MCIRDSHHIAQCPVGVHRALAIVFGDGRAATHLRHILVAANGKRHAQAAIGRHGALHALPLAIVDIAFRRRGTVGLVLPGEQTAQLVVDKHLARGRPAARQAACGRTAGHIPRAVVAGGVARSGARHRIHMAAISIGICPRRSRCHTVVLVVGEGLRVVGARQAARGEDRGRAGAAPRGATATRWFRALRVQAMYGMSWIICY